MTPPQIAALAPRAQHWGFRRNLLRPADSHRADRVTYIELFFDLIFVLALTQLSRSLSENQTLVGALEFAILMLAIWWIWVYTTWVTNWLNPVRLPVRGIVIGLSFIGLVMSASLYESFGDRGIIFAAAYVSVQLGRTVFMLLAVVRHDPVLHRTFVRILIWLSVASIFWIVGAFLPPEPRLLLWAIALGIELLSAGLGFRVPGLGRSGVEDWDLSGPHIAERSALFVIIALGESLLVTGFAFVEEDTSPQTITGMFLAFVTGVAMWWLYFDHAERVGRRAIAASTSPGRVARLAYTYVHAIIIAGIVLTSVADKAIILHPDDEMTTATTVLAVGGPLLYIAGLLVFRLVVANELLVAHLVGIGLLVAVIPFASLLSPLGLGIVTTGILVITASWETIVRLREGTTDTDAG
ncbi:low temperature requirement protein A [Cryobacterium roopkundense]|uniref:Low temperature requirement protein LtrA n=1 Tax=Cryobacterium roopkundense TaxID=1001240 RepID=A0A7W8ZZ04_9MICO|nr:low temperature requirement protein A [Cryobacterium roopkundense]MBB5642839.1 low temperature requirement protein LtrA [Cryobacterium roopkundense]